MRMTRHFCLALIIGAASAQAAGAPSGDGAAPVVVVDPGHGGPDFGARGPGGFLEKNLALAVSRLLGAALERQGFRIVFTRESDRFVTLAERTEVATRASGDVFVSIHANAGKPDASGVETYFLSSDATDEDALQVARVENAPLWRSAALPGTEVLLGSILQDLAWTAHLERSSRLAADIQHRMSKLPTTSRGVKQAPFVVLMGVNMPAVLVEIGFLTHPQEGLRLREGDYQIAIARALAGAVAAQLDGKGAGQ